MSDVVTIADSFTKYRTAVIPANASAIQIEECRRAFYAGSYFMLVNLRENIGDDSMTEEDGIHQLERLQAECETFLTELDRQPSAAPVVEQSSYNVRHPEIEQALRNIAQDIKPQVPDGFGSRDGMTAYQVRTPWWARGLIRLGEALIALGEPGRRLEPDAAEESKS